MTNTRRVAYCVVLALCSSACSTSANNPPADDGPPASDEPNDEPETSNEPTLVFAPSYEAAEAGETQTVFDLLATDQIVATFSAPAAEGVQFVRVDLYVPSGAIYQRYWQAYSGDPELVGTEVAHPEDDSALRVQAAEVADDRTRLYLPIPVSAGAIGKNVITGTFHEEIFFAGETEPAALGEFEVVMP